MVKMGFYDNEEQIYETSENILGVDLRDLDEEEQIIYIMENSVNLDIKLTVDGSVGNNYGEAK